MVANCADALPLATCGHLGRGGRWLSCGPSLQFYASGIMSFSPELWQSTLLVVTGTVAVLPPARLLEGTTQLLTFPITG